ncbi:MAG: hypothetical protein H8E98_02145 [Bacteroidetes bacterium]|nr:hypothetical protein [Bacteroidota bacterium]
MKKIVVKVIIAIAIGLIACQWAGNKYKITRYYEFNNGKKEITKEQYNELKDDYHYEDEVKKISTFNINRAYTYGILSFSILIVILLIPEFFERKNTINQK